MLYKCHYIMSLLSSSADNALPIFVWTFLESTECSAAILFEPGYESVMHRGTVCKKRAPSCPHRGCNVAQVLSVPNQDNKYQLRNCTLASRSAKDQYGVWRGSCWLTYLPRSSMFWSFIPGGTSQGPDQRPKPVLASENSPGRSPLNSLLMNLACISFGKW